MDCDGNIVVADNGNNRTQKFTEKGEFIGSAGSKGNGSLQFSSPSKNHRVQILNSDLPNLEIWLW